MEIVVQSLHENILHLQTPAWMEQWNRIGKTLRCSRTEMEPHVRGRGFNQTFAVRGLYRIGTVRLREELGGITPAEWKAAREGTFQTTVLALGMELMRGLSITDPDVPGGSGVFRCTAWTLNPDMSIDMAVRTTTDSMYDLVVGPKAVDVPANEVPVEFYPFPLRSAWHPNAATYGLRDT